VSIRFGTDGWRAIIANEFTDANVLLAAHGIADSFGADDDGAAVIVGHDTRFASDRFALLVAEALAGRGLRVLLSDRPTPTPALAYAIIRRGAVGGVMVTASHNPAIFNGLKVKTAAGSAADSEQVAHIEAAIARHAAAGSLPPSLPAAEAEASGRLERLDLLPDYHARLAALVDIEALRQADLTVVVDAMFGAGGGHLSALLAGGSTRVVELNGQPNPAFPGLRGPEPVAANLIQLSRVVAESRSHLGLALDGDADRIGLVDERGRFVTMQEVFALLTRYLVEQRGWRGPIVKSVNATTMLDRLAEGYGLAVHTTPVGFKYLGPALIEHNGLIAGEESGGFAFRGHIPERDGLLAGLFLIDLLRRAGGTVSELVAELQATAGPSAYDRLDLTFSPAQRPDYLARLKAAQPARLAERPVQAISDLDGTKFVLDEGRWLLVRFSGTEPLLRLYAEGHTDDEVARLLAAGRHLLGLA
jgi:phosphomannomutase